MRSITKLIVCMAMLILLNGCIVTSAVGLAASTVMTAGEIAVKTTGAVADVIIPDSDDESD